MRFKLNGLYKTSDGVVRRVISTNVSGSHPIASVNDKSFSYGCNIPRLHNSEGFDSSGNSMFDLKEEYRPSKGWWVDLRRLEQIALAADEIDDGRDIPKGWIYLETLKGGL